MHCEGEKQYDQAGDCAVCGMPLVAELKYDSDQVLYQCLEHPNQTSDIPEPCPDCGELMVEKPAVSPEQNLIQELNKKFVIALIFTIPIFLLSMGDMLFGNKISGLLGGTTIGWISLLCSLPVVFYSGWMFFTRAVNSLKSGHYNMFTLIGIGAGFGWLFSLAGLLFPDLFPSQFRDHLGNVHLYFESTTVILTLVLFGQLLEAKAHNKTNSAIKKLLGLAPKIAYQIINNQEVIIPIKKVKKGDLLKVKPGGNIPVDGHIVSGGSLINESMVSGEPFPVQKQQGDFVFAGTSNTDSSFVMKAQKVGSQTMLAQIVELVNKASRSQAPIQKLADKISSYFVPIVIGVSVLTFLIWVLFGPEPRYVYALINSIAVLIIACPCAIGLATPMSIMVGVGKSAQNGILVKNAAALQTLSKVNTLVIDKTGTLTEGKPSVERVISSNFAYTSNELTALLASLNKDSEHLFAHAILSYAKQLKISLQEPTFFKAHYGEGVEARVGALDIGLGNKRFLNRLGAVLPDDLDLQANTFREEGKTVSFATVNQQVVGFVVYFDPIKPNAKATLDALKQAGVDIHIATGDNQVTAEYVAHKLHVSKVTSGCSPIDKLALIKELQASNKIVAMAGDGVNDAPALTQANVGLAMSTGVDIAIESADITLLKGDIQSIVKAVRLSKKVMLNIKQNLFFALIYNLLGVPIAAGILFPFFGLLLSPMIAALAMSLSSVFVISNALRLRSLNL